MNYMLTANEKNIASEWEKYAGYTVRPLPSTTAYYHKLIKSHTNKENCLIYGGTPEIRSIFQKLNRRVTLIDKSENVVRAMGRLTISKKPIAINENFIKQDWLTIDLPDNQFDLIIGDDAINMVEWHQFDTFLKNTHRLLNSNGIFICHLLVKPDDDLINKDFNSVLVDYFNYKIKTPHDLASHLNFICYDNESYGMGWQKTIESIGKENLEKFKPEFDFIETFRFCNSRFYCPPQTEFEKLVDKYFHIEELFYPHEHAYCQFEPVYILEKK